SRLHPDFTAPRSVIHVRALGWLCGGVPLGGEMGMPVAGVCLRPGPGGEVKRAAAWGLLVTDLLADVAITVMAMWHTAQPAPVAGTAALALMAASFAVVGGLLALRRPGNAEGWLLLAVATAWSVPMTATAVGQSLLDHHAGGTAAAWLAWPAV